MSWSGRVFVNEATLLYVGPLRQTEAHRHHAYRIIVSPGAPALVACEQDSISAEQIIIPPDIRFSVHTESQHSISLYVEPDSAPGSALGALQLERKPLSQCASAAQKLGCFCVQDLQPRTVAEGQRLVQLVFRTLGIESLARTEPLHPTIAAVQSYIRQHLEDELRLADLAKFVGLSEGRLTHLFREHVGISLRPYILWRKLERVVRCLADGESLTYSAHAAGFTDSSHLHRVVRQNLGLGPTVLKSLEWVISPE